MAVTKKARLHSYLNDVLQPSVLVPEHVPAPISSQSCASSPQPLAATSLLPALFALHNAVALVTCCVMLSSRKTGPASSGEGVQQHGGWAFFKNTLCLGAAAEPRRGKSRSPVLKRVSFVLPRRC